MHFIKHVNSSQLQLKCITVSSVGSQPGQVNVYDSLLSGSTHSRTKKQIAAILFSPKEKITINFPAVQIQHDCGLFEIGFW